MPPRLSVLIHDLSDWVLGFAESEWAIVALAVSSFIEAIFFPIPPDPLLVGVAILRPGIAIWLGALVALTSVAGAIVGHWIGGRLGRPLLYRWFPEARIRQTEKMFARYGTWATLLAAFTPIPYKVFAITAGVLQLNRRQFIIASLIGRGARYVSIGALVFVFGEEIEAFIADYFGIMTLAGGVVLVVAVVVWGLLHRRQKKATAVSESGGASEAVRSGE